MAGKKIYERTMVGKGKEGVKESYSAWEGKGEEKR